jgi:predicted MPP superfamily phosphohydrolase
MNASPPSPSFRYQPSQTGRTLVHPLLPQDEQVRKQLLQATQNDPFTFIVCADTQIGIASQNREWETELAYSRDAIRLLNNLQPRPLFCCVCGDLVDMESTIFATWSGGDAAAIERCDEVQNAQNRDWKATWNALHEDIALVCVCGNHDVGNRPNAATMQRFVAAFGDDYLAFWVRNTYNIVLNTNLFSDPNDAMEMYEHQLAWLESRLCYAQEQKASHVFVFGHHPWFLYHQDETDDEMSGASAFPKEWGESTTTFPDRYFHIPLQYRKQALALFEQYSVTAAFSGHFHQNMVSKAAFGMDMIITSSLSLVFESTGIPDDFTEPRGSRGVRIVTVQPNGGFQHEFVCLD